MFNSLVLLLVFSGYALFLFALALWVERMADRGRNLADNPYVYSLSLAVYCTAWTYYGSVGKAATSGMLFLTIYIGPMICAVLWWQVVRRMVRAKNGLHITSIADFLAARFGKSPGIAALASLCALAGTVPYISLQLKGVIETFEMISLPGGGASSVVHENMGVILVAVIIVFVIIFGLRRVDPTERHQGMMVVVALESVIKLGALMAVGVFVTYFVYDGFNDIFSRLEGTGLFTPFAEAGGKGVPYATWASYLILAMAAILFLPRQFHVMVVENSREKHILTAMWLFPLYLAAINFFVLPIAMGGLLLGLPAAKADYFVLRLPMAAGKPLLTLMAFIGGFSASMSMIMIASMTMAVMISNNLILPVFNAFKALKGMRRRVLLIRWVVVAGYVLIGYAFYRLVGEAFMLVNIGIISFAAVLQFAPCALGGMFWPRAGKAGAYLGLASGFAVWFYTLILPALARGNWLDVRIISQGPLGIRWLKPEALFGVSGLDTIPHSVFFSLVINTALFVVGSLAFQRRESEKRVAREFLEAMAETEAHRPQRYETVCSIIPVADKLPVLQRLLSQYLSREQARTVLDECLRESGVGGAGIITILQLADLHAGVERRLAGVIGSAAANRAMLASGVITEEETAELTEVYGGLLAEMRLSPEELKRRIDYYRERENLLTRHADELQARVLERDREIVKRKRVENALRQARKKYRDIFENAIEGIYQCTPDGVFLAVNPSMARILGYSSSRQLTSAVSTVAEDLLKVAEDWVRFRFLIMRIGSVVSFETRMRRKDGEVIWVSLSGRGVKDDDGGLAYVEGSMQDVTERRRAQEEVFKLNAELEARVIERTAELEAANKELEAFSYSVSHDLRAPLRSIDGFSQVLLEDYADSLDSEGRNCLDRVRRATQRMGDLIDDLLHLTRVTRSEMNRESVNLSNMFAEVVEEFMSAEKGREVDVVVEPGLSAKVDSKLIRVLLSNLVSNALKFTSHTPDARIEFGGREQAGHKVFFIRDNGAGFDPRYSHKMFGAFNRLHSPEEFEGTGIGLAIVERVIQRHGGVIWAEGEVDKGAVFWFTLETKGEGGYGIGSKREGDPAGGGQPG